MIVASLLLVIAAAVTLLIGLLNRETLEWVYASIACCLLAGLLLTIGVLRSRPSRKPVLQSGGEGQGASWAGAASHWGGGEAAGTDVLTRDDDEEPEQAAVGDDDPTRTSLATDTGQDAEQWAPAADDDATSDVRVVTPDDAEAADAPAAPEPAVDESAATPLVAEPDAASAPPQADPDTAVEDEVVVVPKPSARGDATDTPPGVGTAAAKPAKSATTGAAKSGDDAARFDQVLSPIAGVGPAKRKALAEHFGTYRKLRAASPDKIASVPGISRTLAERIHQALHGG